MLVDANMTFPDDVVYVTRTLNQNTGFLTANTSVAILESMNVGGTVNIQVNQLIISGDIILRSGAQLLINADNVTISGSIVPMSGFSQITFGTLGTAGVTPKFEVGGSIGEHGLQNQLSMSLDSVTVSVYGSVTVKSLQILGPSQTSLSITNSLNTGNISAVVQNSDKDHFLSKIPVINYTSLATTPKFTYIVNISCDENLGGNSTATTLQGFISMSFASSPTVITMDITNLDNLTTSQSCCVTNLYPSACECLVDQGANLPYECYMEDCLPCTMQSSPYIAGWAVGTVIATLIFSLSFWRLAMDCKTICVFDK